MADMIKFFKGLEASLPATGTNGALYITTDEGAIYLGTGTGMKRLGDFVQVANVAALPTKAHESCLYYCVAENILAKWNGTEWKQINKQPTAEELKVLLGLGSLAYKSEVEESDLAAELKEKVNAAAEGNHAHANKGVLDGITAEKIAAWDAAEQNAKDYADANDADTKYGITYDSDAKKIKLVEGGTTLEIDATAFIKDGMIQSVELVDENGAGHVGSFLKIVWNTDADVDADDVTYVDLADLVDVYTGSNGTTVDVAVSNQNVISASVHDIKDAHIASDAAIAKSKLAADVQASLGKADSALQSHQDISHLATKTELGNVDKKFNDYTTTEDLTTLLSNKQDTIPANTYDAYGAAATAKSEAIADAAGKYLTSVEIQPGSANGTIKYKTQTGTSQPVVSDDIAITGLEDTAFIASDTFVKKSEATGYDDILTKTAAAIAYQPKGDYQPAGDYATKAQGDKADTAVQSVYIGSLEAEKKGTAAVFAVADVKTELGLGTAAFTDADAYATAAQGAKADSALQTAVLSGGTTNGTLRLQLNGESISHVEEVAVTGLKSAAYTEASDYAKVGDVYAKTETYTKTEVDAAIAAAVETAHTWGSF